MRIRGLCLAALCAALLAMTVGAASAQAGRVLLSEELLHTVEVPGNPSPPPEGEIEAACGLAVGEAGLYVSDYYHRAVDVFSPSGDYQSQIALPGSNPVFGTNTLDSICALAFDSTGTLYANEWHQSVLRLQPTEQSFDSNESTGVAVGEDDTVYVDDRTYVAVYEPSGAPVLKSGQPPGGEVLQIGLGSLGDAYGLAVYAGKVYVPDAASETVKVYEPASPDPLNPVATIAPPEGFSSLADATLTVDPTNGHLLVVDNLQPGFEHPKAAVDEFNSSGAFLDRLPGAPVDGEPSGIAVDSGSGKLYVTSGNDEGANVFAYGPYSVSLAAEVASPALSQQDAQQQPVQALATSPSAVAAGEGAAAKPNRTLGRSRQKHKRRHRPTRGGRR
jgi:DNA-binding beta-propeller fold protein YncE